MHVLLLVIISGLVALPLAVTLEPSPDYLAVSNQLDIFYLLALTENQSQ
jgi:hypothetical protein